MKLFTHTWLINILVAPVKVSSHFKMANGYYTYKTVVTTALVVEQLVEQTHFQLCHML